MHAFKRLLRHITAAAKYSDEDIDRMSVDEARAALRKCMAEEDEEETESDDDEETESEDDEEDTESADDEEDEEEDTGTKAGRARALVADRRRISRLQRLCLKHGDPVIDTGAAAGGLDRMPLFAAAVLHGWRTRDVRELLLGVTQRIGHIQRGQFIGCFPSEADGRGEPTAAVQAQRESSAQEAERIHAINHVCAARGNPSLDFAADRHRPGKTRRRDLREVAVSCGWSAQDTADLIARHLRGPVAPGVTPHLQGPVWDE